MGVDDLNRFRSSVEAIPPGLVPAAQSGRSDSVDRVVSFLYEELREIAHRHLARNRGAGRNGDRETTLSTTAVVHEAYLKLVDQSRAEWRDRAHFLAVASAAMRHLLVDRARARGARKRGGAGTRVTLDDDSIAADDQPEVLFEIDNALRRLAVIDSRLALVVEYRFFGGLSEDEIGEVLGVTVRTVQRDWKKARMLLRRYLEG
ncbi:MAG: ECF-type sigma factor [Gemmatimonadaceae bacterium]